MKHLFFTNTPAHVHLYKHAVRELDDRGHDVHVLARDYGCTVDLLDWYDLPYTVYGRCGTSKTSLFRHLPRHYANIARFVLRYRPDHVFGMGGYAAPAGALSRASVTLILDSEPTSLDHAISKPFADAILTPEAFRKDLGPKHFTFAGFKENAYLHPDVYETAPDIRAALGLDEEERYAIVRFNAFGSHHDVGHGGFSPAQRRALIDRLDDSVTVFVSDEGDDVDAESLGVREFDLHPARLHDALAEADLLVADSQTVVTEAAMLGTPTIRSNSFVGEDDMGNFIELEAAGLIRNVAEFDEVMDEIDELLAEGTKRRWQARRDEYVADQVNLTEVIVDVATNGGRVEGVEPLSPAATRIGMADPS